MHKFQLKILNKLLYTDKARFSELKNKGLTSEHFTYHLNQLVAQEFIKKDGNNYMLTNKGKDFVGKLDEKTLKEEKGPKVSVLIFTRKKDKRGRYLYLMSKRLKQPYLGKIGGITGKVRFGETFYEAAARELLEETGLVAEFKLCHVYHKIRRTSTNVALQDSIFLVFLAERPQGKEKRDKYAELIWLSKNELFSRKDLWHN